MRYKFFAGIIVLFGPLIGSLIYTEHYIWAGATWLVATLVIASALAKSVETKTPSNNQDITQ